MIQGRSALIIALLLCGVMLVTMARSGGGRTAMAQEPTQVPPNETLQAINATVQALSVTETTTATTGTVTATATITASPAATEPFTAGVTPAEIAPSPTTLDAVQQRTPTPVATGTITAAATPSPTTGPPIVDFIETNVLTGTIVANRTEVTVTFFFNGQIYELPAFRSIGLPVERSLTAVNLFNCPVLMRGSDSDTNEDANEEECFWDPYPVRRDGFYEIIGGEASEPDDDPAIRLILEEAAPPPTNQAFIQNRTGHTEQFLHQETLYELENSNTLELALDSPDESAAERAQTTPKAQIYLRRCLGMDTESVCEWLAHDVVGGVYYALVDSTQSGPVENSAVTIISVEPVLGELPTPATTPSPSPEPSATPAETAEPGSLSVACQIQVPTLNVRSGPGLQYLVIGQVGAQEEVGDQVSVVGRTAENDWLSIDPTVVEGGWISNLPQFIACVDSTERLPVAEVTDGRLLPLTPTPVASGSSDEEPAAPADEETADEDAANEVDSDGIGEGRALLTVTNSFETDIRFTLSARQHGLPDDAPSEYDLAPGDTIQLNIRAGRVQFTASTPFRGGNSGNAEFILEEGQSRELFLHFVPAEGDSDRWEMRYE